MSGQDGKFGTIWTNGDLPDPKTVVIKDIVEDLWPIYVEEITSFLSRLETAAMSLESGENTEEDLAEIKRVLHSIKGDSGMSGILDIHDLCHDLESALDELQQKDCLVDVLLKSKDWIEAVVEHLSDSDLATEKDIDAEQSRSKPKLKVLVIDDDIVCRERLKMLLQDFFDYTYACDGQEGLQMYAESLQTQNPYKLVTLDINMPGMNGHETLEAIRRVEQEHGITGSDGVKIIMTTSEGASKHVFAAFNEGCEAYVAKANMGDKLLDEIAKLGLLKVVKVQKDYVID
jgi:CheY-like chemotaxis protein/HPt (histidine-containing phosphotransfer) domain-containing protein